MPTQSTPDGDAERWREILAAGETIQSWIEGLDEPTYLADERTCAAVSMYLVIIGEAVIRISAETKDAVALPWPQIASLRHRIAHGYASIDHRRVWHIVSRELDLILEAARDALTS